MATLNVTPATAARKIHWLAIVGGAVLLELLLFVVLIPIGLVFGMPGVAGANDFTVFFVAVPIGCFVGGFVVSLWVLRNVASRRLLHGALLGGAATLTYLAICATQPGGIPVAIAGYGAELFWGCQAMRIAGCLLGASRRHP
jgi:hypothetical protein